MTLLLTILISYVIIGIVLISIAIYKTRKKIPYKRRLTWSYAKTFVFMVVFWLPFVATFYLLKD